MTGTVTVVAAGTTTAPPPPGGGGPAARRRRADRPARGGPAPDETRPAVSRFDKGKRAFSFRLSERATVRIVIARAVKRAREDALRGQGHARPHAAWRPGSTAVGFRGRLGGKALAAGRYRATVTATDAAGNRSAAAPCRIPDPRPLSAGLATVPRRMGRRTLRVAAAALAVAGALLGTATAAEAKADHAWLCRPGLASNPA